jgi:hypothetical protein
MKYLSDYMNDKQTALFKETGAFFAFSKKQFCEQKKDGVVYNSLGAGMICPKDNAEKLMTGLETIAKDAIQEDIAENGIKAIIHRELGNHECQITMDITDAFEALDGYDITRDQISEEWDEFWAKCVKNDWF